jgi:uncharacterized membrane protein
MTWLQRYRVRQYVTTAIWFFPVVGMAAALVAVRVVHWVEIRKDWDFDVPRDTAIALMATLASSMFTFVVFVSSALLIIVQLASQQLTPRILGLVLKDTFTKLALALFVFTFVFALGALVRFGRDDVPLLTGQVAKYASIFSLVVFLALLDHVARSIRPSGAVRRVATQGRAVIEAVYPRRLAEAPEGAAKPVEVTGEPACTVPSPHDGVVLALDVRGLVALASRADCVIEVVPQVGDFVAAGDPLFRVYQARALSGPAAACAAGPLGGEAEAALCQSVAIGDERTLEQDATFAFRILVDIASKGLSPAVNDPTTAVLAIDQIHHLLRKVGERNLEDERVRDAAGRLRLVYRTPDWADFVQLAVTEIRHFGGTSIQVARRLRAMLENLIQTLPAERVGLLQVELDLLHRTAKRFFLEPEDQALADVSDFQGVGGNRAPRGRRRDARPSANVPAREAGKETPP